MLKLLPCLVEQSDEASSNIRAPETGPDRRRRMSTQDTMYMDTSELISNFYRYFMALYGNDDFAMVATTAIIDDLFLPMPPSGEYASSLVGYVQRKE